MSLPRAGASLLLPLFMGCHSGWDAHNANSAPGASLDGTPTAVTRGVQATFRGTAEDDEQTSADLTVSWTFTDPSGDQVQLERSASCEGSPQDEDGRTGRTACSVTVPLDLNLDLMTVALVVSDGQRSSAPASLEVAIGNGNAPTCILTAPAPQPDEPCFADTEILLDGTCTDVETAPEALSLTFVDTYDDASGQPVSDTYSAGSDPQDTASPLLMLEHDGDSARLYGYVALPASEHDHTLCLTAEDETSNDAGNTACVAIFVYPANTAPWCELLLPVEGSAGPQGEPLLLEARVGDDQQDMAGAEVAWYSDQYGSEPFATSLVDEDGIARLTEEDAFSANGAYTVTAEVEDMWAVRGTCNTAFVIGEGPAVHIDAPAEGDWLDDEEIITFAATFDDGQSLCEDLTLEWLSSLDGTLWGPGSPVSGACTDTFIYDPATLGPLSEGEHEVYLYVTDGDGFTNADVVNIEIGDCTRAWYLDLDGDEYGSTAYNDIDGDGNDDSTVWDCTQPSGYADLSGDCDDWAAASYPGATEICNGLDDDCDGAVDQGFDLVEFYLDADGDGYGDGDSVYDADEDGTADSACSTATISGYSSVPGDCDDSQPDVNPGEPELCDDTDHDCDGSEDNGFYYPYGTLLYRDADADGYGAASTMSCQPMSGWVMQGGDCDEADASIHPGATEVCDTTPVDDDCDGYADPAGAAGCVDQVLDSDGDGYGTSLGTSACVCTSNPGRYSSTNTGDCDDATYAINPGMDEVCDPDGIDEDCDGTSETDDALGCSLFYFDADGDDHYAAGAASRCLCSADGSYTANIAGDCDDSDAAINPAAAEVCDVADTDEDCDGLSDDDDGSASGQPAWYRDADGDGFGLAWVAIARCEQPSGYVTDDTDCDDTDASIYPGATTTITPDTIGDSDGLSVYDPTCGDREFDGNGPYVYCDVTYTLQTHGFSRSIACGWQETTDDWSAGDMSYSDTYTVAPASCSIASIATSGSGALTSGSYTYTYAYMDADVALDTLGPWTTWLQSIEVYGDLTGDDLDCDDGGWSSGSNPCSRIVSMVSNTVTLTFE